MLLLATTVLLDTGKKNAGCLRFKQPRAGKNARKARSSTPKARFHCNHNCALGEIICNAPGFTAVRYAAARVETSSRSDAMLILVWLHGRAQETQRAYRGDVANFTALLVVRENGKYYARWLFGCKYLGPITQKAHEKVGELRVEAKLCRM